eukprot:COSAG03_NODE_129_length_12045_cov_19.842625_5_plen_86_part_00
MLNCSAAEMSSRMTISVWLAIRKLKTSSFSSTLHSKAPRDTPHPSYISGKNRRHASAKRCAYLIPPCVSSRSCIHDSIEALPVTL